jgi:hypothetical protein
MDVWKRCKKNTFYPLEQAKRAFKGGQQMKYKVVTINWIVKDKNDDIDYKGVHRKEYIWTLEELKDFIRARDLVSEDVISILPA